eukprot:gene445-479_t
MTRLYTPKYPVVDPNPSMTKTVANFNLTDLSAIGLFTFSGFVTGWFGARKPLRAFNSRFTAGIGLMAGFSYAVLGSTQRLLGIEPNESEVKKYGALTPSQVEKLESKLEKPLITLIDSNYDQVEEEEKKL